jgi:hypothetical protein
MPNFPILFSFGLGEFSIKICRIFLMHQGLIEGFSMIQEHSKRRHDLQDVNVTNKTNKLPSFLHR